jgi:hypothetical protein
MEPDQLLKVGVNALAVWRSWEFFYGKMGKDGRILVPKLTLRLIRSKEPRFAGFVMDVSFEPA